MGNMAKGCLQTSHIMALSDKGGKISTDPKQLNLILQEFYKSLYTAFKDLHALEKGRDFLQKVKLPTTTSDQN